MRRGERDETAAGGDQALFAGLFREHADALYGFCLRLTRDAELAEDARSMVFYEAWRRRHEVDLAGRAPRPWLYGVAANVVRNQRRSIRRYEEALKRIPHPGLDLGEADEMAARADALAEARTTRRLLDQLTPSERTVALLCLANGWSYAATAAQLDLPIGTVRSRLSRARARLKSLAALAPEDHALT